MTYELTQPIPTCCDVCRFAGIMYCDNDVIYGTIRGSWPKVYYCPKCKALTSCHPGTNIPKGFMATSHVRRLRKAAHAVFDKLWQDKLISRSEAYIWMAEFFQLPMELAHIGTLTADQLKELRIAADRHYVAIVKRKEKQHARKVKRSRRESESANRGGRKRH